MSEDPHDLLAAYALDALDDDERERFERHLEDCDECSEQLALLREPVVGTRLCSRRTCAAGSPAGTDHRRRESRAAGPSSACAGGTGRWPPSRAIAAAAACLAIGLGIWANSLSNSLDQERNTRAGR